MEIMEGVHLHLLLLLVTLIQGIQGQVVTPPPSVAVAIGDDVSLKCTTTAAPGFTFSWTDVSTGILIYSAGTKQTTPQEYVNFDLDEDTTAKTSTLIINDIQDTGEYRCGVSGQAPQVPATVTVEKGSDNQSIALNITGADSNYTYQATYDAIGSLPEETITWILNGDTQTTGIVETDPDISTDPLLFDKRSVFTFPSTPDNYNVTLECNIGGHQVAKLDRQETILVNIHKPPQPGVILIDLTINGTELTISCDDTNSEAVPAMSTLNIYSGDTLITKPDSERSVTVTEPEQRTEFRCEGSNYLGTTTTSQFYGSTTAPPPTTALETTTLDDTVGSNGSQTADDGPNVAAIAGGVVAAIVIIVIIVIAVCYCKTQERFCFEAGGFSIQALFSSCKCSLPTPAPSNKPSGRAVGSSNGSGSEKEKLPQAAPRGHGSIQHTNDNPDQAMYAMVDKKPARGGGGGAGDAPDRGSAPGQNEPPGMLYADLDLSHKAGHTDKHVPKNENDVVVYSSILV